MSEHLSEASTLDHALLGRYLASECTAEDAARVDAWRATSPNGDAVVTWLEQYSVAERPATFDTDLHTDLHALWDRISARVERRLIMPIAPVAPAPSTIAVQTPRVSRRTVDRARAFTRIRAFAAVAICAAAICVAVVSIAWYRWEAPRAHDTAMQTVRTAAGQRARVRLPDGSAVQLAPESMVRYASSFGRDARDLELQGEAVFTVIPDGQTPFRVRARHVTTQVLGTVFGIRAYGSSGSVRVVVAEGKVSLDRNLVLTLGEGATVDRAGVAHVTRDLDVTSLLGWTQGRLVFRNTPFSSVTEELQRWYGVPMVIEDSTIARTPVTAELDSNSPADDALGILAQVVHARYHRVNGTIVFSTL